MDRVLAVIPVYNRRETTLAVLESLRDLRTTGFMLDVLVIDDGSTDGTAEAVAARFPDAIIVCGDGNLWWGGALNVGFRHALEHGYDYIYTLNDDISLRDDTLDELYKAANRMPDTVCGSMILREDGRILSAGYIFSTFLHKLGNPHKNEGYDSLREDLLPCETLSTQSTLIPFEVLKLGLFIDAKRFPHNYSDLDYFDRVRKSGFRLAVVRSSVIQASESSSNYHLAILNKSLRDILRSFRDVKYAHNLRTQWNIAFRQTNPVLGTIRFVCGILPYVSWLTLRTVLPRGMLLRLLVSLKRISPMGDIAVPLRR